MQINIGGRGATILGIALLLAAAVMFAPEAVDSVVNGIGNAVSGVGG